MLTFFLPLTCRNGGALPDGTAVVGERLVFTRPLRRGDSGVYQCTAKSSMGTGKSEYMMSVAGERKGFNFFSFTDAVLENVLFCSAKSTSLLPPCDTHDEPGRLEAFISPTMGGIAYLQQQHIQKKRKMNSFLCITYKELIN